MTAYVHPERGPLHLGRSSTSPFGRKQASKFARLHDFMFSLPAAPDTLDNTSGITDWGMMLNDSEGDCTCAATGHLIQAWTAKAGIEVTVPDSAVQTAYEQACGYNPSQPWTDQGGIISNVLDYFRDTGVGGYKIDAHAEVNITQLRVQQAVYLFGGVDIGVQLPVTAQSQVGDVWTIVGDGQTGDSEPCSWGGHSVAVVAYDPNYVTCVTWGKLQKMTWFFFMKYVDEVHACIFSNYPFPVSVDQLASDLQQVGS